MELELIGVQPGMSAEDQRDLCVLAGEVCHGTIGKHKSDDDKEMYLSKIRELKHWSIFEHMRYVRSTLNTSFYALPLPGMETFNNIVSFNGRNWLEANKSYTQKIVESGHSVNFIDLPPSSRLVHASATFLISDVSRSLTHQLVRHRMASYSQQSQRHVHIIDDTAPFWIIPNSVVNCETALAIHPNAMTAQEIYEDTMQQIRWAYLELQNLGIPREDARFLLPNATKTQILVTMTFQWWIHFIKLRLHKSAQWEIRELANMILEELELVDPENFSNIV